MQLAAIYHRSGIDYRYFQDSALHLKLQSAAGDLDKVTVLYDQKYYFGPRKPMVEIPMEKILSDGIHDYYEAVFLPMDPRLYYLFRLEKGNEVKYLYASGFYDEMRENLDECFIFASILGCEEHVVPDWARGCVCYQIFVDRFHRVGELTEGLSPWGTKPDRGVMCGGNLKGILEKIDYIHDLGVDLIYLTPIFLSGSNHRYDTLDYFKIDPLVGDEEDLKALCDAAHARGMHLVLDGVFNHCSIRFFAFQDLLEKGENSRYKDWFFPKSFPVDPQEKNFDSFSHGAGMPKLNMENPEAREYFCKVGAYWVEKCGTDGWRLDVANEIDHGFLRLFRQAVLEKNPQAIIVGESWTDSFQWMQGDMFDGVMHYPPTFALRDFFQEKPNINLEQLNGRLVRGTLLYSNAATEASWVMLDSHDTSRLRTLAGSIEAFRAAAFLQVLMPGSPLIYYGDEIGLEGGDDPDCRRCMPWDQVEGNKTRDYYKKLVALKHLPAFQRGKLRVDSLDGGVYVFRMCHPAGDGLCMLNLSGERKDFAADTLQRMGFAAEQERLLGLEPGKPFSLEPYQGAVFTEAQKPWQAPKRLYARQFRQNFPPELKEMLKKFMERYRQQMEAQQKAKS